MVKPPVTGRLFNVPVTEENVQIRNTIKKNWEWGEVGKSKEMLSDMKNGDKIWAINADKQADNS